MRLLLRPYGSIKHYDYSVGAAASRMIRLVDLGISPPDQILYYPYAQSVVLTDYSKVGVGVPKIEWIWDVFAIQEAARFNRIIFGSDAEAVWGDCYIKSDIRTGAYPTPKFQTYPCRALRPDLFGTDGTPVAKSPFAIQTIKYTFFIRE